MEDEYKVYCGECEYFYDLCTFIHFFEEIGRLMKGKPYCWDMCLAPQNKEIRDTPKGQEIHREEYWVINKDNNCKWYKQK